jgi:hypothetical protein
VSPAIVSRRSVGMPKRPGKKVVGWPFLYRITTGFLEPKLGAIAIIRH